MVQGMIKINFKKIMRDYIWFGWIWIGGWTRLSNHECQHIIIKKSTLLKNLNGLRHD